MEAKRISPRGVQPRVPVAQGITANNVQHAYLFKKSRYQQRRIEAWGKTSRQMLVDLGAKISKVKR